MPEQEPAQPPKPPEKPIRSGKWGLIIGGSIVGVFVFLDLMVSIHRTAPAPNAARGKQPQAAPSASAVQSFEKETKQLADDLQHRREALQAAIAKARGVDLGHLMTPLPECNQAEREKLNGRYFMTATAQGDPVRLACEQNDQWAVIPEAAASIQPLTPQQQQALAGIPQYGAKAQSPAERRNSERAKRREDALNSSSVALDFSQPKNAPANPKLQQQTSPAAVPVAENNPEQKLKYQWDAYTGPLYRVFEGTLIETVLTNRLNGEFTGPVNVMVTTDLWSHDHQHILMPQGTRILGEAQKVSIQQQRRLAVILHRAIMPDGYSVAFDKFVGLDQQGATGLTGNVNTHWAKVIGTAVLVGAIGGLSEGFGYSGSYGPGGVITTGIGAQTGQQATQILDRALNVLPSVTVYEGTRVRLWTAADVELPAYENHRVNPSL